MDKRYLLGIALIASCKLDLRDGDLLCNHNGKACPDGYHCAGDDRCYLDGHDPDLSADVANDLSTSSDLVVLGDSAGSDDLAQNPDLTPVKAQGDPCVAGVDLCATGHCVDGYCCNSDCGDPCAACDVSGSLGMCSAVTGPPHASRSCNGSGTCGGKCMGASTTCTYPAAQVICGAACDGHCDGVGSCSAGTGGSCPNGFACGSSACLTSCSQPQDCQPNFMCQAPNCVRVPESDCLDGLDNNGDGLADCADPTCTTVECVHDVTAGNEVGVFTSGACPTDYGSAEILHQTLITPNCTGCGCTPTMTCTATIQYSTVDNACSSKVSWGTVTAQEVYSVGVVGYPCFDGVTLLNLKSIYWSASTRSASTTAAPTGSASAANAYWDPASQMSFCPARTSATCPTNQVCVRKRTPAAPVCARVPGAAQPCPAGYATGTSDTWYASFSDNHSCGACGSCSVTNQGDCGGPIGLAYLSASSCSSNPSDLNFNNTTEGNGPAAICDPAHTNRTNRSIYPSSLGAQNAACSCGATLLNPATRAQASTVCCQ